MPNRWPQATHRLRGEQDTLTSTGRACRRVPSRHTAALPRRARSSIAPAPGMAPALSLCRAMLLLSQIGITARGVLGPGSGKRVTATVGRAPRPSCLVARAVPFSQHGQNTHTCLRFARRIPTPVPLCPQARTNPLPPSTPPNNFNVDAVESDSIAVRWDPPVESNGSITGYKYGAPRGGARAGPEAHAHGQAAVQSRAEPSSALAQFSSIHLAP